ncbi:MAG: hypothetical protein MUC49_21125 [Raineya sp.]|jgi:hypothetical protein|nr:hypothetical protein [Raineya sp.]
MAKKGTFKNFFEHQPKGDDALEVVIYQELQALIPPLTTEELVGLEQSILLEGCREPLTVWKNGEELILVDGHNRYGICKKHNLHYKTFEKEFSDLDAVKDWMISNQLGRRNLSELQKSYLRGLQYNREKKGLGGDRKGEKSKGHFDLLTTAEKLAEEHKVSEKTIKRDEKFAIGLDKLTDGNKELKDKILNKEIKIPQSIIQEASTWEKKKIDKAKKAIEAGNIDKLIGELKNVDKKIEELKELENKREQIVKAIFDSLKDASIEDLNSVLKILKIKI